MKRNIWENLIEWKSSKNRKPLILRGARQVGKTFILKQFASSQFQKLHYVNCESHPDLANIFEQDKDPVRIINELSFYFNQSINIENDVIFFDEVQAIPQIVTALKYFYEDLPQLAICAAGSLLGVKLNEASFPVGKVTFLDIYPMNFIEFLQGIGEDRLVQFWHDYNFETKIPQVIHKSFFEKFIWYCIIGGLPDIVSQFSESKDNFFNAIKNVRHRQQELIYAYTADMAKHSGKENAMHIQRLWENIPAQLAKHQDSDSKRFRFKNVVPEKNRYVQLAGTLDWLDAAGLLIKTYITNNAEFPFSAYISENNFKLYIFDIGILGALSGLSAATLMKWDYGTYKGFYAENFAAQEMMASSDDGRLYSWKGRTSEIEFIKEINGYLVPIKVKSGAIKKARSLSVFSDKYNPEYKIILSGENFDDKKSEGLYKCPIYLAGKIQDIFKKVD